MMKPYCKKAGLLVRRLRRGAALLTVLVASLSITCGMGASQRPSPAASPGGRVLNGIDVLRQQKFAPLAGKRIGLLTNHTGLAADGRSTIDLLQHSGICRLVALFSPEHGIRGKADAKVKFTEDPATGLPIYSLYGDSTRPTRDMLRGINLFVVDLQDIGARFYTYATTMAYCMEAAAEAGIPFYVLDRPNPIGGTQVEGPMLDANRTSFTAYMPLPIRHGMTLGELARYFNAQNKIGADLHVVPMSGWSRDYYFYDTGQLWVNPSPNMRNIWAAILYPGVCLLEGTNVSVGRGTDRPFEIVGAPWIDPRSFAEALTREGVPGVRFVPIFFTPDTSTNMGEECGGVGLIITDVRNFNSVLTGLTLISILNRLYKEKFTLVKVMGLLGSARALESLAAGESPAAILHAGLADMEIFLSRRQEALIY